MSRPSFISIPPGQDDGEDDGRLAHFTTAQLWLVACDRLGLPYSHTALSRWDRCRVWDEIDRIRAAS